MCIRDRYNIIIAIMGNVGAKLDGLTIYVQTKQPYYSPDDLVDGSVYMDVLKPLALQRLDLCVKGKERIQWEETTHAGGHRRTSTHSKTKKVFKHTVMLHRFTQTLGQGQYEFPFCFQLPSYIPGTFNIKHSDHEAYIKYVTVAMLYNKAGKCYKYNSELVVREVPIIANCNKSVNKEKVVTTCCSELGRCALKCWFESDVYQPGEEARLACAIDNTHCQARIKNIDLNLIQILTFRRYFDSKSFNHTVCTRRFPGIAAGAENLANPRSISLRLQDRRNENEPLQPNIRGQLVECRYVLNIIPEFEVECDCCVDYPLAELLLFIHAAPLATWVSALPQNFRPSPFRKTQIIIPEADQQESYVHTKAQPAIPMAEAFSIVVNPPAPQPIDGIEGLKVDNYIKEKNHEAKEAADSKVNATADGENYKAQASQNKIELKEPDAENKIALIKADSVVPNKISK
eukprot:TRINITY_DN2609_c0_g2_i4.p1 TRINITY_DN2609_c0_g2~~TRINITY_DN2609_c0_g2_i4.p1  ORF type:complete len:459 (-),score=75.27 TRINITY_DN2609_c0_g2_i4:277-1653(-)